MYDGKDIYNMGPNIVSNSILSPFEQLSTHKSLVLSRGGWKGLRKRLRGRYA